MLAETLRGRLPYRGRTLRVLVDADVGVPPPVLAFLVNLAFSEEARVQPAVWLGVARQFDPGENRTPSRRASVIDALTVD